MDKFNGLCVYFLILNLVVAILGFSYMVGAQMPEDSLGFGGTSPMPTSARGGVSGVDSVEALSGVEAIEEYGWGSVEEVAEKSAHSGIVKTGFKGIVSDFFVIAGLTGLGALVGGLAGGSDGEMWGAISGLSGALAYSLAKAGIFG